MDRREFLKTAAAAASVACFPAILSAAERDTSKPLERRALGKTGAKLSIIGFGGLLLNRKTPERSAQLVREAFEAGVNYFDVAPEYGNAQERLGQALAPYRKKVFLSCKTAGLTADIAAADLDASLKLLRTDRFDLYQLHHVSSMQEVDTICGPDGALGVLRRAKESGKARFLGFSAHSVEAAMALMDRFDFDTIMFPVNYASWSAGSFGPQVLARAREKKMGIIALKAMCKGAWAPGADRSAFPGCWYEPMSEPSEAMMGLRFTLSHPVATAIPPAVEQCHKLALSLAPRFTPLKADEAEAIKKKAMSARLIFAQRKQG